MTHLAVCSLSAHLSTHWDLYRVSKILSIVGVGCLSLGQNRVFGYVQLWETIVFNDTSKHHALLVSEGCFLILFGSPRPTSMTHKLAVILITLTHWWFTPLPLPLSTIADLWTAGSTRLVVFNLYQPDRKSKTQNNDQKYTFSKGINLVANLSAMFVEIHFIHWNLTLIIHFLRLT